MADNEHRQTMSIAPESGTVRTLESGSGGELELGRRCCTAGVRCCYCCGPKIPRWACCSMCLVLTYIAATPLLYLAIHFCVFPGNIQGDFRIPGASEMQFHAASSDGRLLHSIALPVPSSRPLASQVEQAPVIFFGGNAQGMSGSVQDSMLLLSMIHKANPSWNFKVHTFAQRGYSPNQGWTSQGATISDSSDFLDSVLNSTVAAGGSHGRVIIGGWSLGAGVALQLAAARPEHVAGVVVFCPWMTLQFEVLRILAPITWMLWPWIWLVEPWDSRAAIASLPADVPVAVVSAEKDQVISPDQHRAIFEASNSTQKWWLPAQGASHQMLGSLVHQGRAGLTQWTKAVWNRVQVFDMTELEVSSYDVEMTMADERAFDLFGEPFEVFSNMFTLHDS